MRYLAALAMFLFAATVPAQDYPVKTVKIVVPAQPGGGLDLVGRTIGEQLRLSLGQSFVVDNIAGGGGVIASQTVARAAPDGYTLMVGYVGTHGTNPAVRKMPYDAVRDFTAIAMVGGTPNVLVVNPGYPANDLKGVVANAKKGNAVYASGGAGTLNHLAMEQFKAAAGFEALHVPHRGIAPAITGFLGGQTQMLMPGLAAALPHIRAGKMKPIVVTGLKRHPLLPNVPTFEEEGYKGFDGVQWYGIVGPANLPAGIVQKLSDAINKAIAIPELRARLASEALEPMPMTPVEFGKFIQAEITHWGTLARERNIHLDD